MRPLTHRSHASHPDGRESRPLPSPPRSARSWRDRGVRLLGGTVAAALGLGLCAVVVLLLWIGSPHPQNGPDGALHVAAAVWLTAHGADLVRTGTGTGEPVPVGLTPLLLTALPYWLLSRAVRSALAEHPRPTGDGSWPAPRNAPAAVRAAGTVVTGYLAAGAAVIAYATDGPVRVEPPWAGLRFGLFAVLVTAVVTWLALGRPRPRLPRSVEPGCLAALRAAGLATAVLTAGGLLLALAAVAWHGEEALTGVERLSGTWSGDVALALLALVLLPNAAVWAAAYGLGPGFTLGGGSVVAPLAETSGLTAGGPVAWATAAVPPAAALALGWCVGRAATPVAAPVPRGSATEDTFRPGRTALCAAAGAFGCGVALSALAALAGGALGTQALAHVGPSWWATGGAALAWGLVVGVPTAVGVRGWRLRQRGAWDVRGAEGGSGGAGEWHETGARRTRWAALKEASGGLMADFPPRGRDRPR